MWWDAAGRSSVDGSRTAKGTKHTHDTNTNVSDRRRPHAQAPLAVTRLRSAKAGKAPSRVSWSPIQVPKQYIRYVRTHSVVCFFCPWNQTKIEDIYFIIHSVVRTHAHCRVFVMSVLVFSSQAPVWKSSQSTAFCADFMWAEREDAQINGNGSLVAEGQKINSQCWNERIQNQWHCCSALKGMNGFW